MNQGEYFYVEVDAEGASFNTHRSVRTFPQSLTDFDIISGSVNGADGTAGGYATSAVTFAVGGLTLQVKSYDAIAFPFASSNMIYDTLVAKTSALYSYMLQNIKPLFSKVPVSK